MEILNNSFDGLEPANINLDADGLTMRMNKILKARLNRR